MARKPVLNQISEILHGIEYADLYAQDNLESFTQMLGAMDLLDSLARALKNYSSERLRILKILNKELDKDDVKTLRSIANSLLRDLRNASFRVSAELPRYTFWHTPPKLVIQLHDAIDDLENILETSVTLKETTQKKEFSEEQEAPQPRATKAENFYASTADKLRKKYEKRERLERKASILRDLQEQILKNRTSTEKPLEQDTFDFDNVCSRAGEYPRGTLRWASTILGVDEKASVDEAKTSYRSKAKVWHPDTSGSSDAFVTLNEAWNIFRTQRA